MGNLIRIKFKERITSEISPAQFPRKSSTARSASLHKCTNECAPRMPKWFASLHKSINDDAPCTPKCQERSLGRWRGSGTHGGQDLTSHDEDPKTSKPSSPSEKSDSRILRGYCGAKGLGNPDPFHIRPKAYIEEEEMSEDEQRRPKLLEEIGHKRKRRHVLKNSLIGHPKKKGLTQWANHGSMVEEQF